MRKGSLRFLILIVGALLLVACGETEPTATATSKPTASPARAATPTPNPILEQRSTTKEPIEGLCIPAAPLRASVGDSWTIAGPIERSGSVPRGEIPKSATKSSTTFTVKAREADNWVVGNATVRVEHSKVQVQFSQGWEDVDGNRVHTSEEESARIPIMVGNLGPVLTLDWDCHREAWLQTWKSGESAGLSVVVQASVTERTLGSGITAIVFSRGQYWKLPEQGIEQTTEIAFGYDKVTGRLLVHESRAIGTWNGEPFSVETVQELVP